MKQGSAGSLQFVLFTLIKTGPINAQRDAVIREMQVQLAIPTTIKCPTQSAQNSVNAPVPLALTIKRLAAAVRREEREGQLLQFAQLRYSRTLETAANSTT